MNGKNLEGKVLHIEYKSDHTFYNVQSSLLMGYNINKESKEYKSNERVLLGPT